MRKGVTEGRRNGGEMRVGGRGVGGEGVSRNRERKGRRRAHVEDITVWVKTQSFFTVRFVKESCWLKAEQTPRLR